MFASFLCKPKKMIPQIISQECGYECWVEINSCSDIRRIHVVKVTVKFCNYLIDKYFINLNYKNIY